MIIICGTTLIDFIEEAPLTENANTFSVVNAGIRLS